MPRYVAFLRGVSPTNASMPALRRGLEDAGFGNVRTVLSSGNVAFDTTSRSLDALTRKIEAAIEAALGRRFLAIVRTSKALQAMVAGDPYAGLQLAKDAKRVVTFLRAAPATPSPLPIAKDGARILAIDGLEVFTAYVPIPGDPVFMGLIEKTFGKDVTTRTWDTVKKCAVA